MARRILMTGEKAKYMENRPKGSAADDREIWMTGDNATYEENLCMVEAVEKETQMECSAESPTLFSPEAMRLWDIAKQKGWVDRNLKPLISDNKAAVLADVMADCLHMSPKWRPFEELWGIDELSSKRYKAVNQRYFPDLYKEMKESFE